MYADTGEIGTKPWLHVGAHRVRQGTAPVFTLPELRFHLASGIKAVSQRPGSFGLERFGFVLFRFGLALHGRWARLGEQLGLDGLPLSSNSSLFTICRCTNGVIEAARGLVCNRWSLSSSGARARCIEFAATASDVFSTWRATRSASCSYGSSAAPTVRVRCNPSSFPSGVSRLA